MSTNNISRFFCLHCEKFDLTNMSDNQQIINVDFFCLHCEKFDLTNMCENHILISPVKGHEGLTITWFPSSHQVFVILHI